MNSNLSGCKAACYGLPVLIGIVGILLGFPIVVRAQQPIATISSLSGTAFVSIQGGETVPGTVGRRLKAGDSIRTDVDSRIVLILSDNSEIHLSENTSLDIAVLREEPGKVRVSRLKLFYGRVRAFLSSRHQKKGSSFDVDTPNAQIGVKFSQPDIEVSYDSLAETTIVDAYTVEVVVRNLLTQEVKLISRGQRGIVRQEDIFFSIIPSQTEEEADETPETEAEEEDVPETSQVPELDEEDALEKVPEELQEGTVPDQQEEGGPPKTSDIPSSARNTTTFLLQARNSVRRSTSTSAPSSVGTVGTGETDGSGPIEEASGEESGETAETTTSTETTDGGTTDVESSGGVGGVAETSTNPSPGLRPVRAERQPRVVTIYVEQR